MGTTFFELDMPVRKRRSKKPLCLHCDARPVRPDLEFFCSLRCAAANGVHMARGMRWCEVCNHWMLPGLESHHADHKTKIYVGTAEPSPAPSDEWY